MKTINIEDIFLEDIGNNEYARIRVGKLKDLLDDLDKHRKTIRAMQNRVDELMELERIQRRRAIEAESNLNLKLDIKG